jgi:hypothetical protein
MKSCISLTIVRGPTPYAVEMDPPEVGGQDLQLVKGL